MHTGGTAVRPGGRSLKHSPSGRIMEEMRGQSRGPKVSHQPTSRHCPDMAALCVCAPGRKAWPQEGIKGGEEGRMKESKYGSQWNVVYQWVAAISTLFMRHPAEAESSTLKLCNTLILQEFTTALLQL
ncbi:hypothetical protein Q7C36_002640 [Tachysurus vachellii]|uniref:Uncharacterized protein n=1 Tax=Tachysurus vachellii TaxID=175792 RepID=A0AA88T917_TACVA|nr:hypothetical protein Q7C36_002640 [Tachysurus vachellii]